VNDGTTSVAKQNQKPKEIKNGSEVSNEKPKRLSNSKYFLRYQKDQKLAVFRAMKFPFAFSVQDLLIHTIYSLLG
jgi:hypothetical protein